jgi:hypothetical protein
MQPSSVVRREEGDTFTYVGYPGGGGGVINSEESTGGNVKIKKKEER